MRLEETAGGSGLTDGETEILGHLCDQVIPPDDFPGGRDLGVAGFIDRLLKEVHPDWLVIYRSGLRSTDLSSQEVYGKRFPELDFSQQTELMKRMERGDLPRQKWFGFESSEFFYMVRDHTMQGYYSHPKWGGNRDKIAWKMIGYDDWWAG